MLRYISKYPFTASKNFPAEPLGIKLLFQHPAAAYGRCSTLSPGLDFDGKLKLLTRHRLQTYITRTVEYHATAWKLPENVGVKWCK
jgi:hypothetical protein